MVNKDNLVSGMVALALLLACVATLLVVSMKPADATFPGKNGDIAFNGNPLEVGNANVIYTINPDGTGLRLILGLRNSPGEYNQNPAWSPDGTKVAASVYSEGYWNGEIVLVNADGTNLVNLTNSPDVSESDPAFFPSGQRIVFCSNFLPRLPKNVGLHAMSFDEAGNATGPRQQLTNQSRDCSPSVSPDGKKIAFVRSYYDGTRNISDIYVIRTGVPEGPNNQPQKLTDSTANGESPLGRRLLRIPTGHRIARGSFTIKPVTSG